MNVWNVHYPSLGDSLDSEEKRLGPYPGVTQTSDQLLQVVKEYFFCAQIQTKVSPSLLVFLLHAMSSGLKSSESYLTGVVGFEYRVKIVPMNDTWMTHFLWYKYQMCCVP